MKSLGKKPEDRHIKRNPGTPGVPAFYTIQFRPTDTNSRAKTTASFIKLANARSYARDINKLLIPFSKKIRLSYRIEALEPDGASSCTKSRYRAVVFRNTGEKIIIATAGHLSYLLNRLENIRALLAANNINLDSDKDRIDQQRLLRRNLALNTEKLTLELETTQAAITSGDLPPDTHEGRDTN